MYSSSTSGQLRHQRSGVLNRNEMLPEDDDAWDTDLECEGGWKRHTVVNRKLCQMNTAAINLANSGKFLYIFPISMYC